MIATKERLRVKYDEFVQQIRPSPEKNEQVQFISGYIGKSDKTGNIRVYLDATLSTYIEIPEEDILYSLPRKPEEDPLGGSRLWIKKESRLSIGNDFAETRTKEEFTKGDLMDYYRQQIYGGTEAKMMDISPGGVIDRTIELRPSRRGICGLNVNLGFNRVNALGRCLMTNKCILRSKVCGMGTIACALGSRRDLMAEIATAVINPVYRVNNLQHMFGY